LDKLRFLVETYVDIGKDRVRMENRLRSLPPEEAGEAFFGALSKDLRALERMVAEEVAREVEGDPLWTHYLSRINGVGPMMAGYLIAWLCRPRTVRFWKKGRGKVVLPPYAKVIEETREYILAELPPVFEVAGNPSKVHRYCGLAPGSRRARGSPVKHNPKVKALCWKVMKQILMAGARSPSRYAELYRQNRGEYATRCPRPDRGSLKLKVHLTAVKMTMRIFMTNFWLTYRRMRGLPVTEPYPSKLGEGHRIYTPEELLDR
jgi:hypothetical protein